MRLNLGCGSDLRDGYRNIDFVAGPGVEGVDLERFPWPWGDESVDEILELNLLEHINNMDRFWWETHRVLKLCGRVSIEVEYGRSRDPFHGKSNWTRASIKSLCNGYATSHRSKGPAFRLVDGPHFRNIGGFPGWHIRRYLHVEPPAFLNPHHRLMRFTLEKVSP